MEKEELKHLAKLLRAFRDESADEQEYILRDAVRFDVEQEFEDYVTKYRHWQGQEQERGSADKY